MVVLLAASSLLGACRAGFDVLLPGAPGPGTTEPWPISVGPGTRSLRVSFVRIPDVDEYDIRLTNSSSGSLVSSSFTCSSEPCETALSLPTVLNGMFEVEVAVAAPPSSLVSAAARVSVLPSGWSALDPNRGRDYTFTGPADDQNSWGANIVPLGDTDENGTDDFLVTAAYYDNGATDTGLVDVFRGPFLASSSPSPLFGPSERDYFGISATGIGDVNGDGASDFVVGLAHAETVTTVGEVRRYSSGDAVQSFFGQQTTSEFGHAVAAGEFDGVAGTDLLVSEWLWDDTVSNEGRVFLLSDIAANPAPTPWVSGAGLNNMFGSQLAGLGNVLGPQGDPVHEWGVSLAGAAQVRSGTANPIPFANMTDIAAAGDVNGDGWNDVLLSQQGQRLTLVLGGLDTLTSGGEISAGAVGGGATSFANRICGDGDFNGDGFADVAAGDPEYDDSTVSNSGRVIVFFGGPQGISDQGSYTVLGNQAGSALQRCGFVGDVDGDDSDDLVVVDVMGALRLVHGPPSRTTFPHLPAVARNAGTVQVTGLAFDALPASGPFVCEWQWGDGVQESVLCSETTAQHTFTNPELAYDATYRVTDGFGQTGVLAIRIPAQSS